MSEMNVKDLIRYIDGFINVPPKQDYCINGLQVEGRPLVRRIVSGVSVCQELIEAAQQRGADVLLVHHGLFWNREEGRVVGMKRARLKKLLEADINLVAYHLPLDMHAELGNNALLLKALGAEPRGTVPGASEVLLGHFSPPLPLLQFVERVGKAVGKEILHIPGGPECVSSVAVCTGAAQGLFEAVAGQGIDAFVTGEISEKVFHIARELGAHFVAAGHHATEVFGVRALGDHLAARFGLEHEFVDIPNPL